MATIINNPGGTDGGNSNGGGSGLIIGVVIAIVVLAILFIYVLPNMRGGADTEPATTGGSNTPSTVNVEVPDQIDVNVKK